MEKNPSLTLKMKWLICLILMLGVWAARATDVFIKSVRTWGQSRHQSDCHLATDDAVHWQSFLYKYRSNQRILAIKCAAEHPVQLYGQGTTGSDPIPDFCAQRRSGRFGYVQFHISWFRLDVSRRFCGSLMAGGLVIVRPEWECAEQSFLSTQFKPVELHNFNRHNEYCIGHRQYQQWNISNDSHEYSQCVPVQMPPSTIAAAATNGIQSAAYASSNIFLFTNQLPALTNGFQTAASRGGNHRY